MGKSLIIKGADFSENGISTSVTWVAKYPSNILSGETGAVVSSNTIYFPISTEITRLGMVGKTIKYIKNQQEHHKKVSFNEEYIQFLKLYNIDYDERYVFTD